MNHPPYWRRRRTKLLSFVKMSISCNLLLVRPSTIKYYAKAFTAAPQQIRSLAFSSFLLSRFPLNEWDPISSSSSSLSAILGSRRHSSSSYNENAHKPTNKFSKLRSQIAATHKLMASATTSTDEGLGSKLSVEEEGLDIARKAISLLAQRNKTWKRLAPIIELASTSDGGDNTTTKTRNDRSTIADIGCDHGLLSIALAASGRYKGVVGVDVSSRALEDGALLFLRKIKVILDGDKYRYYSLDSLNREDVLDSILPVQFRVGDGLTPLFPGEADSICIAGVGVHTILSILMSRGDAAHDDDDDDDDVSQGKHDKIEAYDIDRTKCNRLLLQPTNSRPRHLIKLYRELEGFGFAIVDERVVYLGSRWYITCAFERVTDSANDMTELQFPGTILSARGDEEFYRYVKHHSDWLEGDVRRNASLDQDDVQWLEHIRPKQ